MSNMTREPLISHPPPHDTFSLHSLAGLADKYDESVRWLTSFLEINSRSRIRRYGEILNRLRHVTDASDLALHLEIEEYKSAFFESHEIIEVCLSLQTLADTVEVPIQTLRKLKSNNYLNYREARESGEQDDSRPTFFELYIASKLIRAGFQVEFTINDADLCTSFEGHNIFIECKRVTSPRKFYERIHDGNKQLLGRYTKGKAKEFGIVFVSITDLINPDFETFPASNMDMTVRDSHEKVNPYVNRVFEFIKRHKEPDKKTIAYFVHAAFPYILTDRQQAVHRTLTSFSSYFHHSGYIPQLGYEPRRRMQYFDEFERFRTRFSGRGTANHA